MAALSHWQLPIFRDLHLEESSVFGIRESNGELCFEMELVLDDVTNHRQLRRGSVPRWKGGSGGVARAS